VTFESLVSERCQVLVAVLARRETLMRAGLFDENLRSVEDFDMWLRIVKKGGRIVYHRQILVLKRCWLGSLSSDQIWMYEHVIRVLKKAQDNFELTESERKLVLRQIEFYHAMIALHTGKEFLKRGDIEAALDRLRNANTFFRSLKLTVIIMMLRVTPNLLRSIYVKRERQWT
jgi:GT2 family glycosyltransferase